MPATTGILTRVFPRVAAATSSQIQILWAPRSYYNILATVARIQAGRYSQMM